MLERTLVFVKPHCFDRADKILGRLDSQGERIATAHVLDVPEDLVRNHYKVHEGKPFYPRLIRQISRQKIVLAVYVEEDIIQKVRDAIGATDPAKASPGTIRRDFSSDSLEKAIAEDRAVNNVIHASDSRESAEYEIKVWNPYLHLFHS